MKIFVLTSMLGFLVSIFSCTFSPSFKGPGYDKEKQEFKIGRDEFVIVSITNAQLIRDKRKLFDKKSRQIFENLNENPGYLGGRVKVEIFGDRVWTLTVWKDRESLNKFLEGRRHTDAYYMGYEAMAKFRSINLKLKSGEVPRNWEDVERLLLKVPLENPKPLY